VKKAKDQANQEDAVGGLADSDAEAIPPPKSAEGKQMGKTTCVNNVCVIINFICVAESLLVVFDTDGQNCGQ
jgi:hypothetical protein